MKKYEVFGIIYVPLGEFVEAADAATAMIAARKFTGRHVAFHAQLDDVLLEEQITE